MNNYGFSDDESSDDGFCFADGSDILPVTVDKDHSKSRKHYDLTLNLFDLI